MDACLLPILVTATLISITSGLDSENIVGHNLAALKQFPYQVLITLESGICGGALIEPDIVLTAAHCIQNDNNRPKAVYAGMIDVNDLHNAQWINVKEIYTHAKYNGDENKLPMNDIALMKLEKEFTLSSYIDLVNLPERWENFNDKTAVLTGFGWNSVEVTIDSKEEPVREGKTDLRLRYAPVKVTVEEGYPRTILSGQMESASGACDGDSGGPLVRDNKVIGILSYCPSDCDETHRPSYYMKVSEYLNFIQGVIDGEPVKEETKIVTFH